jgi:quercetin dioxygenase-like cupin family protein
MKESSKGKSQAVILKPGQGRQYNMGTMQASFKADREETGNQYSISEWWLDPYSKGPGIHQHEEDDVFYVLEGTMSFHLDGKWIEASKGSFVLAPGGTKHDFENRSSSRAGVLNFSVPGNFETNMPMIVDWFKTHPLGKTNE